MSRKPFFPLFFCLIVAERRKEERGRRKEEERRRKEEEEEEVEEEKDREDKYDGWWMNRTRLAGKVTFSPCVMCDGDGEKLFLAMKLTFFFLARISFLCALGNKKARQTQTIKLPETVPLLLTYETSIFFIKCGSVDGQCRL